MMLVAALLLAGATIDEAEHALRSGRVEQAGRMLDQLVAAGAAGDRVDRLRAGTAAASGRNAEAFALFASLAAKHPGDAGAAGEAALAAFRTGKLAAARSWSDRALSLASPRWRDWNLCGAIADTDGRFDRADQCYGRAQALAPGRVEILNNRGWSRLLRGQWSLAAGLFRDALAADPANSVVRSNLALAEAALSNELPARRAGESADDYAARLNDAGVIAAAAGDRKRAIAALANAVTLRPTWSARSARNLADIEGR